MSADNGIYILVTKRGRNKKEYRVIHTQAIENVQYMPDYPVSRPCLNKEELAYKFGNARVFTDRGIAEGYAVRWHETLTKDGVIVEYGICWLEYPYVRFPSAEYVWKVRAEEERWRHRHDIFPDSKDLPSPSSYSDTEWEAMMSHPWQ